MARNNKCRNCRAVPAYCECSDGGSWGNSGGKSWSGRMGGGIDGHPVTVKFGDGINEGHTLIDDGDRDSSNRDFNRRQEHNHYGNKREKKGRVNKDRGFYTGPGH